MAEASGLDVYSRARINPAGTQVFVSGHPIRVLGNIQTADFGDPDEGKMAVTVLYGMAQPPVDFPQSADLFQAHLSPAYSPSPYHVPSPSVARSSRRPKTNTLTTLC